MIRNRGGKWRSEKNVCEKSTLQKIVTTMQRHIASKRKATANFLRFQVNELRRRGCACESSIKILYCRKLTCRMLVRIGAWFHSCGFACLCLFVVESSHMISPRTDTLVFLILYFFISHIFNINFFSFCFSVITTASPSESLVTAWFSC